MHPDEATEPIVDVATKLNKPFAIVPCCVFPTLFPDRVLRDGTKVILQEVHLELITAEVVSTAQFCDYLVEKIGARAQIDYLEISGRNKVIFISYLLKFARIRKSGKWLKSLIFYNKIIQPKVQDQTAATATAPKTHFPRFFRFLFSTWIVRL